MTHDLRVMAFAYHSIVVTRKSWVGHGSRVKWVSSMMGQFGHGSQNVTIVSSGVEVYPLSTSDHHSRDHNISMVDGRRQTVVRGGSFRSSS